jgi:3-isopropylmalate dehydrogenase
MMIEHLGFQAEANAIEDAIRSALQARECTRDVGGDLSTAQAGDAVARRVGRVGN